jgi:hypothetical protein
MPVAAGAQTDEELAAIATLQEALDDLNCITVEGCIEELAELKVALEVLRELFADLDYGALDGAIADLEAAITGGDLDAIKVAADALKAAGAAVIAAAEAAAGGGTTTTIAAVETDLPDGGSGSNVALLGMAALLVLLAGGALALRVTADRR